ncbi:Zinc knuckle CX2CX4HX4C [Sesbania bispinosa]|nr:Zinc knuckle CX2CX4HX4C [Sesbania bispinosa]
MTSTSMPRSEGDSPDTPEEDTPHIIYDDEDINEAIHACSHSLVGRIITKKPIHTNSLQNALVGIWCNPKGLKIEEIQDKTFQIFFEEERDADRVLKGSPWLFRNSWLILKKWERGREIEDMIFTHVPIKIQLWGLPSHCKTPKMGMKIGSSIGEVKQAELFETRERGSFIKILVHVDITKPLKSGVNVGSRKNGINWIDFQYERLPQVCYSCGLVGHDEELCSKKTATETDGDDDIKGLGPWIRASQIGRKSWQNTSDEAKEGINRKKSQQRASLSGDLLEKLSTLSVVRNTTNPPVQAAPNPIYSQATNKENLDPMLNQTTPENNAANVNQPSQKNPPLSKPIAPNPPEFQQQKIPFTVPHQHKNLYTENMEAVPTQSTFP